MQTLHFSSSLLFPSLILLAWPLLISSQQAPSQSPSASPSQLPFEPPSQPPSVPPSQPPSLPPSPPQSSSVACKSTPYPKLCRTILSAVKSSPSGPYSYGKFTIKQCVKQASRLSKVITGYAKRVGKKPGSATAEEIRAVADCGELSQLSVDYLQMVTAEFKTAEVMTAALVEHVNSLLSGVVTNQQTCLPLLMHTIYAFYHPGKAAWLSNIKQLLKILRCGSSSVFIAEQVYTLDKIY